MTVIVVKKENGKIIMGADREVGFGNGKISMLKFFEVNGIVFSTCGSYRDATFLRNYLETNNPPSSGIVHMQEFMIKFASHVKEALSSFSSRGDDSLDSRFLIAYKNRCYHWLGGCLSEVFDGEYRADGSGMEVALGTLASGGSVKEAVITSIKHSQGVGQGIDVWTIEGDNVTKQHFKQNISYREETKCIPVGVALEKFWHETLKTASEEVKQKRKYTRRKKDDVEEKIRKFKELNVGKESFYTDTAKYNQIDVKEVKKKLSGKPFFTVSRKNSIYMDEDNVKKS